LAGWLNRAASRKKVCDTESGGTSSTPSAKDKLKQGMNTIKDAGNNAAIALKEKLEDAKTKVEDGAKDVKDELISLAHAAAIMPHAGAKLTTMLPFLNKAMAEGQVNTCLRKSAFIAQLALESGELRYMEELASGAAYEGRKDLGNTQPGDGKRFKGRGPIQLTGRANYAAAGKALGLDLVGKPETVATPEVGFRTTVWFWKSHGLNELADKSDFLSITKRINGGTNGLAQRQAYYAKAKHELGC